MVAVAVAGGRHRIDGIHLVTGRDERLDPQTTVGFDPDYDLVGLFSVPGQELMKLGDTGKSLRQSTQGQPDPELIHQVDVVMILRPIVADEYHEAPPRWSSNMVEPKGARRQANGSVLSGTTPHQCYRRPSPTGRGVI
jgi:hypothetical protein